MTQPVVPSQAPTPATPEQVARTVPVRAPDGAIWDVPEQSLPTMGRGWAIASEADLKAHDEQRAREQAAAQQAQQRLALEQANAQERGTTLGKLAAAKDIAQLTARAVISPLGVASDLASAALSSQLPGNAQIRLPTDPLGFLSDPLNTTANKVVGGTKGQAYAEGVSSGLSLGLDKGVIRQGVQATFGKEAGDAYENQQKLLRDVERSSYMQGEVTGMLAGSAAGGEAAKAGMGLLAGPQGALARVGNLAERVAARALPTALTAADAGLGARMASGAVSMGVRGAAEMGIIGATQELGEEMLGDQDLAGQKIFASAGHSAMGGLVGGAIAGAVAPAIGRGAAALKEQAAASRATLAQRMAPKAEEMANSAAWAQTNAAKKFQGELEGRFGSVEEGEQRAGSWMFRRGLLDDLKSATPEAMLPKALEKATIDQVALESAMQSTPAMNRALWEQTGAGKGALNTLARKGFSAEDAGEWLAQKGLADSLKKAPVADALPQAIEALNQDGQAIGALRGKYNTDIRWSDIEKDIRGIKRELSGHVGPAYRQAEREIDGVAEEMYQRSGAAKPLPKQRIPIDVDPIAEQKIPISVEHAPKAPDIEIPISVQHAPASEGGYLDAAGVPRKNGRMMKGNYDYVDKIEGAGGGYLDAKGVPRGPGGKLMPGNTQIEAEIPGLPAKQYKYSIDAGNRDTLTLEQLVGYRQDVDQMLGLWQRNLGLKGEIVSKWRNVLEQRVMTAFDDAAKSVGDVTARAELTALKKNYAVGSTVVDALREQALKGGTAEEMAARWNDTLEKATLSDSFGAAAKADPAIKALRDDYLAGKTVTDALKNEVEAATARQKLSPTAKAIGVAAGVVGGLSSGGPAALAAGAAGSYATRLVQRYGNAYLARTLRNIADVGAAYNAVQATNRAMDSAVEGMVATPYRGLRRAASLTNAREQSVGERYDAAVKAIGSMQSDSRSIDKIAEHAASIEGAPNVSNAYAQTLVRATNYLGSIVPPQPASTMPGQRPTRPDYATQAKVVKAYEAVTNPDSVYKSMAAGKIDIEAIDALKIVRPAEYAELRWKVIDRVGKEITAGKMPSSAQQMNLMLAFDIQVSPTLTPQALALQAASAKQSAAQHDATKRRPSGGGGGPKPLPPAGFDSLER